MADNEFDLSGDLGNMFSLNPKPGQQLFQLDPDGNISLAEFVYREVEGKKRKSLLTKKEYRYLLALNIKNAIRKFKSRTLGNGVF